MSRVSKKVHEEVLCEIERKSNGKMHLHRDENGLLVKCYHKCRVAFTDVGFWISMTLSFPFEHWLWEHVPPFKMLTALMGL